ncbi:UNVERIFIED_CONTAM: hypothetical protein FKN15_075119 [Acipenser sinensis]
MNDVSYALQYRFVRLDSLGRETVYPFSLSCSTESPWNPREIVCEENYMEGATICTHQTGMTPKTMTAADARTAGYLVNSTSSRVIFRSPYGMPMSEVLLVSSKNTVMPNQLPLFNGVLLCANI